jgi:hypothetical protein
MKGYDGGEYQILLGGKQSKETNQDHVANVLSPFLQRIPVHTIVVPWQVQHFGYFIILF